MVYISKRHHWATLYLVGVLVLVVSCFILEDLSTRVLLWLSTSFLCLYSAFYFVCLSVSAFLTSQTWHLASCIYCSSASVPRVSSWFVLLFSVCIFPTLFRQCWRLFFIVWIKIFGRQLALLKLDFCFFTCLSSFLKFGPLLSCKP